MHEFGLCEGLLDSVRRRANGRPVARVRVRAGIRHAVDEGSMAQAFSLIAQGTEAEGAALDLVIVGARVACRTCGTEADTMDVLAVCPDCHGTDVKLSGGDELVLESIEYAPAHPLAG